MPKGFCICNKPYVYRIRFAKGVDGDLKRIPPFHKNRILDGVEKQLTHQPTVQTKNRKVLESMVPPWEAVPPIWELRIGDYRVSYDVSEEEEIVYVRAIRRKPAGKKTEEIL